MYFIRFYFQGSYAFNITLDDDKFIRIFPSGEYKKTVLLTNDDDKKIVKIVMDLTMKP